MFALEAFNQPVDDLVVKIVTAKMRIAVCRKNLENAVAKFKDGNVKRTAAMVEDENLFVFVLLVKTVSQSCGRWFVDDAFNFESGNLAGIFCCLTLRIVEVCRHRDNGLRNFFAKILFSIVLDVLKNHCRNFLWSIFLAFNVYLVAFFAHVTLD